MPVQKLLRGSHWPIPAHPTAPCPLHTAGSPHPGLTPCLPAQSPSFLHSWLPPGKIQALTAKNWSFHLVNG